MLRTLAGITLCALSAIPAFGSQRTFVSTAGVNNPACSLIAPCRDFAAAVAATSPNGEVIVLDSGGYGKVTITQSVSIIASPGVYAGISVFAPDDGVTVAAGASDKVTLRGLTINSQGGNNGIVINAGGNVHIENCTISNFVGSGISVLGETSIHIQDTLVSGNAPTGVGPSGPGLRIDAQNAQVYVVDSKFIRSDIGISVHTGTLKASHIMVSDNLNNGLFAYTASTPISVMVSDSTFLGNGGDGVGSVNLLSSVRLSIVRSTIARNSGNGIRASTGTGGSTVFLSVADSAIVENGQDGVGAGGSGPYPTVFMSIADSAITRNADNGVHASGMTTVAVVTGSAIVGNGLADLDQANAAVLRTSGNNTLTGRGAADISGTLTPNPLQ